MKRIILAALAALGIAAVSASASPPDATLTVSPNPSTQGQNLSFSGTGYQPGKQVQLWVYLGEEQGLGYIAFVEEDGSFGPTDFTYAPEAGSYTVTAQPRHGNKILATAEFTVS